jgi:hypothetical protein
MSVIKSIFSHSVCFVLGFAICKMTPAANAAAQPISTKIVTQAPATQAAPAPAAPAPAAIPTPQDPKMPKSLSDRIKSANSAAKRADDRLQAIQEDQGTPVSTGQILTELVPVYYGEGYSALYMEAANAGVKMAPHFGNTMKTAYASANAEAMPEARTVKVAKVTRLGSTFTMHVLDQDTLHLPEYEGFIEAVAGKGADAEVLEVIQAERMNDERELESFANPTWGQFFNWWWNS